MPIVNGVPAGGDRGGWLAYFFLGQMEEATNTYNSHIFILLMDFRKPEAILLADSDKQGISLCAKIDSLQKDTRRKYGEILTLYRWECSISAVGCRFGVGRVPCRFGVGGEDPESGLTGTNCQLHQIESGLATMKDAAELANQLKDFIFLNVLLKPWLKEYYINMFNELRTWDINEGEPLADQLIRQMSLINEPSLMPFFAVCIQTKALYLERRFSLYDKCQAFGSAKCVLCGGGFENTLHGACSLRNVNKRSNPRVFYGYLFKSEFYRGLVDFIEQIPDKFIDKQP